MAFCTKQNAGGALGFAFVQMQERRFLMVKRIFVQNANRILKCGAVLPFRREALMVAFLAKGKTKANF